jgi:hypothetical protein
MPDLSFRNSSGLGGARDAGGVDVGDFRGAVGVGDFDDAVGGVPVGFAEELGGGVDPDAALERPAVAAADEVVAGEFAVAAGIGRGWGLVFAVVAVEQGREGDRRAGDRVGEAGR